MCLSTFSRLEMSPEAVTVLLCGLVVVATPLPIPASPAVMSPVNSTVRQCVLNAQTLAQTSILWADHLVTATNITVPHSLLLMTMYCRRWITTELS